jgi:hypothetical protein
MREGKVPRDRLAPLARRLPAVHRVDPRFLPCLSALSVLRCGRRLRSRGAREPQRASDRPGVFSLPPWWCRTATGRHLGNTVNGRFRAHICRGGGTGGTGSRTEGSWLEGARERPGASHGGTGTSRLPGARGPADRSSRARRQSRERRRWAWLRPAAAARVGLSLGVGRRRAVVAVRGCSWWCRQDLGASGGVACPSVQPVSAAHQ